MVKSSSDFKRASGKYSIKLGSRHVAEIEIDYRTYIEIYSKFIERKNKYSLKGKDKCKNVKVWHFS